MKKTGQIRNTPQQKRLLKLLQERKHIGVYVYEITNSRPQGLGIAQYNTRISELRDMGHVIDNVVKGHFVLKGSDSQVTEITPLESQPREAKNPNMGRVVEIMNQGVLERIQL